jgi:hypothetical protein
MNPQLLAEWPEAGVTLVVDMWERQAAQRVSGKSKVNDLFVQKARESHLTVVLLLDEIRSGTQEEFEGAVDEEDVQLAVLIFGRSGGADAEKLASLRGYFAPYRDEILFNEIEGPDSDASWFGLFRTVTAFTLSALREAEQKKRVTQTEIRPGV